MNGLQYTSEAFTSKSNAVALAKRANTKNKTECYYKENPSFEELVDLLERGHIVRRTGNATTFAWVDCDKDTTNPHIDDVSEALRKFDKIAVVQSSSGSPFKYHIVQAIPNTPKDGLEAACNRLKQLVHREVPSLTEFDPRCDNFEWNLFGVPQYGQAERIRLKDSIRISKFTNGDITGEIRPNDCNVPPYSSGELAKKTGVLQLNECGYRCDIVVPIRMHGKLKLIPTGRRFSWCTVMAKKLLLRSFHLEQNCNYPVSKNDYAWWLRYTIMNCCVSDAGLESIANDVVGYAKRQYDLYKSWDFGKLYEQFSPLFSDKEKPKREYRSRKYFPMLIQDLIHTDWNDDSTIKIDFRKHLVVFPSRNRLSDIATLYESNYRSFVNFGKHIGWTLKWAKETPVDGLPTDEDGNYLVRRGSMTRRLKQYLVRHKLGYKVISRINTPIIGVDTFSKNTNKSDTFLRKDIIPFREQNILSFDKNVSVLRKNGENGRKTAFLKNKCCKKCPPPPKKGGLKSVIHGDSISKRMYDRVTVVIRRLSRGLKLSDADKKFRQRHRDLFEQFSEGRRYGD